MKDNTKWYVLVVSLINGFITPFTGSAITVALPKMATDLEMDAIMLNWATTAFLLATAICLIPMGRLADIYERKRFLMWGDLSLLISSLAVAFSPNATFFIFFRIWQGISSSMIFGTSMAILANVFAKEERGKMFGISTAAVYVGLSMGPFLGGIFTDRWGWRSIFLVVIFLLLIAMIIIGAKIKTEWVEARGERFDLGGAIIYGVMLGSLTYGFSKLPGKEGYLLIIWGLILCIPFILWQHRHPSPIINLRLFRTNPLFAYSNLAALIHYSATAGVGFLLSLYLGMR